MSKNRKNKKAKKGRAPKARTIPHTLPNPLPAPGLDGSYSGSCIVCLKGTDTACGVRGPVEGVVALLKVAFGFTMEEAGNSMSACFGLEPGVVPTGDGPWFLTLCGDCAAKAKPRPLEVADPRMGLVPCALDCRGK